MRGYYQRHYQAIPDYYRTSKNEKHGYAKVLFNDGGMEGCDDRLFDE